MAPNSGSQKPAVVDDLLDDPPALRWLRRLVTTLIVVLILAVLAIAGTLVTQLGFRGVAKNTILPPTAIEADAFHLPEGEKIQAIGQTGATVLMVTSEKGGQWLYQFDAKTGRRISRTAIGRE